MKISIIGAGNVGAMTASRIIDADLGDVVLVDIVPGLAKGKALDISDARPITGSKSEIIGSEDFKDMEGSDIVVMTAGLARKPGMSRDDLLQKNAKIIKDVAGHIKNICKYSIVIVVTNPLDVMSYVMMKETGFDPSKVIGMAGVLDSARFANVAPENIEKDKVFMMGSHGDTMVAINRSDKLKDEAFKQAADRARQRGAEIVSHLKTGSAYFSPSAAAFAMVRTIIKDEQKTLCASAYLNGEYNEKDIYIGVPITLGASGVKKVIEIKLTESEKTSLNKSANSIRESIKKL
ncbi:malate dehydrogenase [Candidatus Omnitrophota bacterium]